MIAFCQGAGARSLDSFTIGTPISLVIRPVPQLIDPFEQLLRERFFNKAGTGANRHQLRQRPLGVEPRPRTKPSANRSPGVFREPHARVVDRILGQPVNQAVGPLAHGEVEKVPELHRRMFAEHVVVLVNVKDEGGNLDHTFLNRSVPVIQDLVMLVDNEVNGPMSPFKDFI